MRAKLWFVLVALMFVSLESTVMVYANHIGHDDERLENKEAWFIGPRIGLSPYTGILGVELQYKHAALTAGWPKSIGLKYYFVDSGHSGFIGGSFKRYSFVDRYNRNVTQTQFGGGPGYRWRWGSGWDLSMSVSFLYLIEGYEGVALDEKGLVIFPGITFGYSF